MGFFSLYFNDLYYCFINVESSSDLAFQIIVSKVCSRTIAGLNMCGWFILVGYVSTLEDCLVDEYDIDRTNLEQRYDGDHANILKEFVLKDYLISPTYYVRKPKIYYEYNKMMDQFMEHKNLDVDLIASHFEQTLNLTNKKLPKYRSRKDILLRHEIIPKDKLYLSETRKVFYYDTKDERDLLDFFLQNKGVLEYYQNHIETKTRYLYQKIDLDYMKLLSKHLTKLVPVSLEFTVKTQDKLSKKKKILYFCSQDRKFFALKLVTTNPFFFVKQHVFLDTSFDFDLNSDLESCLIKKKCKINNRENTMMESFFTHALIYYFHLYGLYKIDLNYNKLIKNKKIYKSFQNHFFYKLILRYRPFVKPLKKTYGFLPDIDNLFIFLNKISYQTRSHFVRTTNFHPLVYQKFLLSVSKNRYNFLVYDKFESKLKHESYSQRFLENFIELVYYESSTYSNRFLKKFDLISKKVLDHIIFDYSVFFLSYFLILCFLISSLGLFLIHYFDLPFYYFEKRFFYQPRLEDGKHALRRHMHWRGLHDMKEDYFNKRNHFNTEYFYLTAFSKGNPFEFDPSFDLNEESLKIGYYNSLDKNLNVYYIFVAPSKNFRKKKKYQTDSRRQSFLKRKYFGRKKKPHLLGGRKGLRRKRMRLFRNVYRRQQKKKAYDYFFDNTFYRERPGQHRVHRFGSFLSRRGRLARKDLKYWLRKPRRNVWTRKRRRRPKKFLKKKRINRKRIKGSIACGRAFLFIDGLMPDPIETFEYATDQKLKDDFGFKNKSRSYSLGVFRHKKTNAEIKAAKRWSLFKPVKRLKMDPKKRPFSNILYKTTNIENGKKKQKTKSYEAWEKSHKRYNLTYRTIHPFFVENECFEDKDGEPLRDVFDRELVTGEKIPRQRATNRMLRVFFRRHRSRRQQLLAYVRTIIRKKRLLFPLHYRDQHLMTNSWLILKHATNKEYFLTNLRNLSKNKIINFKETDETVNDLNIHMDLFLNQNKYNFRKYNLKNPDFVEQTKSFFNLYLENECTDDLGFNENFQTLDEENFLSDLAEGNLLDSERFLLNIFNLDLDDSKFINKIRYTDCPDEEAEFWFHEGQDQKFLYMFTYHHRISHINKFSFKNLEQDKYELRHNNYKYFPYYHKKKFFLFPSKNAKYLYSKRAWYKAKKRRKKGKRVGHMKRKKQKGKRLKRRRKKRFKALRLGFKMLFIQINKLYSKRHKKKRRRSRKRKKRALGRLTRKKRSLGHRRRLFYFLSILKKRAYNVRKLRRKGYARLFHDQKLSFNFDNLTFDGKLNNRRLFDIKNFKYNSGLRPLIFLYQNNYRKLSDMDPEDLTDRVFLRFQRERMKKSMKSGLRNQSFKGIKGWKVRRFKKKTSLLCQKIPVHVEIPYVFKLNERLQRYRKAKYTKAKELYYLKLLKKVKEDSSIKKQDFIRLEQKYLFYKDLYELNYKDIDLSSQKFKKEPRAWGRTIKYPLFKIKKKVPVVLELDLDELNELDVDRYRYLFTPKQRVHKYNLVVTEKEYEPFHIYKKRLNEYIMVHKRWFDWKNFGRKLYNFDMKYNIRLDKGKRHPSSFISKATKREKKRLKARNSKNRTYNQLIWQERFYRKYHLDPPEKLKKFVKNFIFGQTKYLPQRVLQVRFRKDNNVYYFKNYYKYKDALNSNFYKRYRKERLAKRVLKRRLQRYGLRPLRIKKSVRFSSRPLHFYNLTRRLFTSRRRNNHGRLGTRNVRRKRFLRRRKKRRRKMKKKLRHNLKLSEKYYFWSYTFNNLNWHRCEYPKYLADYDYLNVRKIKNSPLLDGYLKGAENVRRAPNPRGLIFSMKRRINRPSLSDLISVPYYFRKK